MKISVVGSINMDQTVTADRIPLKGETLRADISELYPGRKRCEPGSGNGEIWEAGVGKCSDAWGMTRMDRS